MVTIHNECMDGLATVNEAAEKIGVSPDTIRRWDKKGLIKATRSKNNYRLFNIKEIERIHNKISSNSAPNTFKVLNSPKKTEYTVIELFAGSGGTALGLENAGLNHQLLVEFDKNCVLTLRKNKPDWNVLLEDVAKVDFKDWEGKIDIVQGGFPCQAFSYAGKQMGFEDARGTLFFEFARCVKEVKPKIAMGENVKGLLKHDNGKTLQMMISILEGLGYSVKYKVVRSQYLDVPQKRERLIILAIRNDLDIPFIFPKEKDYTVSLREALKDCPSSEGYTYSDKKKKVMGQIPQGGYWRDLPLELQKEYMGASFFLGGGKTGMARRLSWDEPSLTLTCSPAQKQTERCHPSETRPLNIREYARIQAFPDNWEFIGSVASQYKQIGNAVPVNLGYHIGKCLAAMLDGVVQATDMEIVGKTESITGQTYHQTPLFV